MYILLKNNKMSSEQYHLTNNINKIKNDVDNLNKVLERDDQTENLENDAKRFEKKTKNLKCQMIMEHLKSRFVLVSIVFIIIFILVIILAIKTK